MATRPFVLVGEASYSPPIVSEAKISIQKPLIDGESWSGLATFGTCPTNVVHHFYPDIWYNSFVILSFEISTQKSFK